MTVRNVCQTCFYFLINTDPELWCYMFKEEVRDCKKYEDAKDRR